MLLIPCLYFFPWPTFNYLIYPIIHSISDDDKKDPKKIFELLEGQLDGSLNISFQVHHLEFETMHQKSEEYEELNDRLIDGDTVNANGGLPK